MSKKELRDYLLVHRDDDRAFYAYADKVYDSVATVEAAVLEWLMLHNPHQVITKVPEKSLRFLITDEDGNTKRVKVQPVKSSLVTRQALIEVMIEDMIRDSQINSGNVMVVFVSKNEKDACDLDRELEAANFNSRTHYSRVVGSIDLDGKFQTI